MGSSALASSLVTNGGFETGDFTGWTHGGDTSYTTVNPDTDYAWQPSHSGNYRAVLGPGFYNGTLTQTLSTVAGDSYTLSYWLANDVDAFGTYPPAGAGNDFELSWNGSTITSMLNQNMFGWVNYTMNLTATGSSTDLIFSFYNYAGYYYLDDVSVVDNGPIGAVPEPASLLLMGSGLLGLSGIIRRRLNK